MVQATLPQSTEQRTCACGTPIDPYRLGELTYYATSCVACLAKMKEREQQEKEDAKLVSLGLQRRYRGSNFENLHDPKPSEQVIEAIRMYAIEITNEAEPSGRGLYLWGPNGTGKTHLAVAAAKTFGHSLFVNTLYLFDALKTSYQTNEPCDVFEAARYAKFLILDDLGSERPTGWVQERLYALLNTRWDEMLSTVFTSNFAPDKIEDIIGARSASRVLGTCLTIEVDGPDHRRFSCAAV
jgi:DNA replication protein DnaC